jgi:DNA ligase-1
VVLKPFEPQLSAKLFSNKPGVTQKNFGLLRFPFLGSIKYDGIRLVEHLGEMHTRSLKVVRNYWVRAQLKLLIERAAQFELSGLDGEVICGPVNHPNAMQNTTSGVQSYEGQPQFTFLLFDTYQHAHQPFAQRYARLQEFYAVVAAEFPWLVLVQQVPIANMEQLLAYEAECLEAGYEGVMLRDPNSAYKFGRSSMLQGIIIALKRFVDDEALVLEYREEMENTNPQEQNELGRSKRSGHQANLVGKGSMGTMICKSLKFTETFRLGGGVGITHALRKEMWLHTDRYQWRLAKYSYQDIGVKERPRLPRWKGWRAWDDLDVVTARRLAAQADNYSLSPGGVWALDPVERPQL